MYVLLACSFVAFVPKPIVLLKHIFQSQLLKYICHFHIKDKNWKGENVVLGNGKVNFDFIFKAIKHNKYVGKYIHIL